MPLKLIFLLSFIVILLDCHWNSILEVGNSVLSEDEIDCSSCWLKKSETWAMWTCKFNEGLQSSILFLLSLIFSVQQQKHQQHFTQSLSPSEALAPLGFNELHLAPFGSTRLLWLHWTLGSRGLSTGQRISQSWHFPNEVQKLIQTNDRGQRFVGNRSLQVSETVCHRARSA